MMGRQVTEVLAPAGDEASLRAALRAGADAVYFGLEAFNARARATNFDAATLDATMRTVRARGARGYVALNTLIFDAELPHLEETVRACANAGVDAIIVQDLGVARLAREVAPDLALHASTQMTCTDASSVKLAASLGARRVILARELSLADIAAIRHETDTELEVFVHGALCVAYSGQCLTSEAIGGRSANRGACAQACRLPYELLVDGVVRDLGERAYLLSPEDLEVSHAVPELVRLGVASIKIEGRLKGPEYVAATTALYRKAVDAALEGSAAPDARDRRRAAQTFSRGAGPGFFGGVDHQRLVEARACDHRGVPVGAVARALRGGEARRGHVVVHASEPIARGDGLLVEGGLASAGEVGGRVWSVAVRGADVDVCRAGDEAVLWFGPDVAPASAVPGRRVFRTNDPAVSREIAARIERAPYRVPLDLTVHGALGALPTYRATTPRGGEVRVCGDAPVEAARSTPLDRAVLEEKLGRLGETPFVLRSLTIDLPAGATLPLSSLNRARRALVEALEAEMAPTPHETTSASYTHLAELGAVRDAPLAPAGLYVLCRNLEQAEAAVRAGADGVYLDILELTGTGPAVRALRERASREGSAVNVGVTPPRIRKPGEAKIDRYLDGLAPDTLLVRGLGALHEGASLREGEGPLRIGDFSLNVTNRLAAQEVLSRGLAAFTPSFDLDSTQLLALLEGALAPRAEIVVHHPMPLFHMEHCVFAALLSDGRDHLTCGRPCETRAVSLRDRAGMDHPVIADVGCRNTVFHAASQSAATLVPQLVARGVRRFRIELVREGAAEIERLVHTYRALLRGDVEPQSAWRSLRATDGYGVVRGSLRVLAP